MHSNTPTIVLAKTSLAALLVLLVLASAADAYLQESEARRLCRQRTGLTDNQIGMYKIRNENCAIDCFTSQGTILTAYPDDGFTCHEGSTGYRCVMGKCRGPEDKIDDELKSSDMSLIELNIKSAFVADRDPYPGQGESDAFVVVEVVSGGEPSYKNDDIVCYTHVVQDNAKPRWNFACKPLPIKNDAKLRFIVMDSDKPDTNPELLGKSVVSVETLLNAGTQTLTLEQPKLSGGPYTLNVEIKGEKYRPRID